jgi:hypothetical protein
MKKAAEIVQERQDLYLTYLTAMQPASAICVTRKQMI